MKNFREHPIVFRDKLKNKGTNKKYNLNKNNFRKY